MTNPIAPAEGLRVFDPVTLADSDSLAAVEPLDLDRLSDEFRIEAELSKGVLPDTLADLSSRISATRVVVVSCPAPDLLRAAASEILVNHEGFQWREIDLDQLCDLTSSAVANDSDTEAIDPERDNPTSRLDQFASATASHPQILLVIWAMTARCRPALRVLREPEQVRSLTDRLVRKHRVLLVFTTDEQLPLDDIRRKRRREYREVKREIHLIGLGAEAKGDLSDARHALGTLLLQKFTTSAQLQTFLKSSLSEATWPHIPLPKETMTQTSYDIVDFLHGRNLVSPELMDALAPDLNPSQRVALQFCKSVFSTYYHWTDARASQLEKRSRWLCKALESTNFPIAVLEIDAIAAMLDEGLPDAALRDSFERQRAAGSWGNSEERVITNIRNCIDDGNFADEIRRRIKPNATSPKFETLQQHPTLDQLVLFVAAYLPALDPDDFEVVLTSLLTHEQAHQDSLATALPGCLSLEQQWEADRDGVLQRCGLIVSDDRLSERRMIEWRLREDDAEWKSTLDKYRHYFVTRQVDHLKDFALRCRREVISRKVLDLQKEQAKSLAGHHRNRWSIVLTDFVKDVVRRVSDERERAEQLKARRIRVPREFGAILVLLQDLESLRGIINEILNKLIDERNQVARELACAIILYLAAADQFDVGYWLGQLYARGDKEDTHPLVMKTMVDIGLYGEPKSAQSAWLAIANWISEVDDKSVSTGQGTAALGFNVAVDILRKSGVGPRNRVDDAIDVWRSDPSNGSPTPMSWLFDAKLAELCPRHSRRSIDMILRRVLEPNLSAFWIALDGSSRTELPKTSEDSLPWYPIFIVGLLVLWDVRGQAHHGPRANIISLTDRALELEQLSALELVLQVHRVFTAFGETLVGARPSPTRADSDRRNYERTWAIVRNGRKSLERHIDTLRKPFHVQP